MKWERGGVNPPPPCSRGGGSGSNRGNNHSTDPRTPESCVLARNPGPPPGNRACWGIMKNDEVPFFPFKPIMRTIVVVAVAAAAAVVVVWVAI